MILPTRNRAATLGRAIESVLTQDHHDLDLVVVDDASTDDTPSVLREVDDDRLRVLTLPSPSGAPRARNEAIAVAQGEVLAFQDSDDVWCDGHLRLLTEALVAGGERVGVAYGRVRRPASEGDETIPGRLDTVVSGDLRSVLPRYNIVNLPSSVIRADVLRSVGGFDPALRRFQDWDLFLSICRRWEFAFVDGTVVRAADAGDRISHDHQAELHALAVILGKHEDLFRGVPGALVAHRMRLVRAAMARRDLRSVARQLRDVVSHPAASGAWGARRAVGRRSVTDRGAVR